MEDRVNHWIHNFHLLFILLLAIPGFTGIKSRPYNIFMITGLLILVQCFHYILIQESQNFSQEEFKIHRICILCCIGLVSWYLVITRLWWCSPSYYVVMNPQNKKEASGAIVFTVLGTLGVCLLNRDHSKGLPFVLLAIILVLLITIIFAAMEMLIKRMVQREHRLTEQMKITALNELKVKNLNRELAIKYQLADLNARLEERENIARNIHNVVGHTITSAIISLQAYRALQNTEPQRAEEKLTAATDRMRLSLEEIRRAVRVLDQETQEISLHDFQQLLVVELNRFSMDTEITVSHNLNYLDAERWMDKRYCEFLHSALTECLNNGIRHGNASEFLIFLQCDTNRIELSVSDNGVGFDQLPKAEQERRIHDGYGIRKMEQFVMEHGGKMKISSENGFRVYLELPLLQDRAHC